MSPDIDKLCIFKVNALIEYFAYTILVGRVFIYPIHNIALHPLRIT